MKLGTGSAGLFYCEPLTHAWRKLNLEISNCEFSGDETRQERAPCPRQRFHRCTQNFDLLVYANGNILIPRDKIIIGLKHRKLCQLIFSDGIKDRAVTNNIFIREYSL